MCAVCVYPGAYLASTSRHTGQASCAGDPRGRNTLPSPQSCPVCKMSLSSWVDFWKCVGVHAESSSPSSQLDQSPSSVERNMEGSSRIDLRYSDGKTVVRRVYMWQKNLNKFSNSLKLTIVLKHDNPMDNLVIKTNKTKERVFFGRKTSLFLT